MHLPGSQSSFQTQWAESLNSYYFRVDLPGFSPEDIDMKVDQGEVKIFAVAGTSFSKSKEESISSEIGASDASESGNGEFQTDEFLKDEGVDKPQAKNLRATESDHSTRRFQTSFQVPAERVQIQNIHAFMEGDSLVVKIPKLKARDLPSFKIKVQRAKL